MLLGNACIGTDYLNDPPIGTIQIEGLTENTLFVNTSAQLSATFRNPQGQIQPADIVWSSSNTSIAVIDGNGRLTALQTGTAEIAANAQGAQASFLLTVTENLSIVRIKILAPNNALLVGQNLALSAQAEMSNGQLMDLSPIAWQQNTVNIASISNTGTLTGLTRGQTKVQANYNGLLSEEFLVSIVENNAELAKITIEGPTAGIPLGQTVQLTAIAQNLNGDPIEGQSFTWVNLSPEVLSLDANGQAQGLMSGMAQLMAKIDDFESPVFTFPVADPNQITQLVISVAQNSLTVGDQIQLNLMALNAFDQEISPTGITWQSTAPEVASINNSGLASALSVGTTTITAQSSQIVSNPITLAVSAASSQSRTGNFISLNGYSVSGTVSLVQVPGSTQLELQFAENFVSQNGPGLYIYLSNQPNSVAGGLEISKLNQNAGAQTYLVPAGVNLNTYQYVFIHCKPFNVPFGRAQLN
ncbi:MAG: hypothetical protein OHK0053_08550 [Microscillaceae bacterium]